MNRIFAAILILAPLAGCAAGTGGAADHRPPDVRLTSLFDEFWQARLREEPTRATYLGDHRYDDRLEDYSEASRLKTLALRRDLLKRLTEVPLDRASAANRTNADIFRRVLIDEIELGQLPDHYLPLKQQEGPHITLLLLKLSQPMKTDADCRKYAARLYAFPKQAEQVIEQMRAGRRAGFVLPRILVERCLPQIESQVVDDPTKCELFATYAAANPDANSPIRRALDGRMSAATVSAIRGFRNLRDFLKDDYLATSRDTVGICHLPGGKAWYERLARYHTTTTRTPQELHDLGRSELERIHNDMKTVIARVGSTADVSTFLEQLRTRADQHFTSPGEMMIAFGNVLRSSDAQLPKLFGRLPRAPYRLKEIEPFRAPAAPVAYYFQAPDDGSRPAYFYINTTEPTKRLKFTMEALAYHEAMPGHHLQVSLSQETKGLPDFRRHTSFTVFVEGWGLYSESLGKDLGGYRDPYQELGRLTFNAWRACRLVVDTGMHYLGWTRQQAIDFMKQNTALEDIDIANEIDRYIAWPGQALAYKVGETEIMRMRAEAEQALGPRFDVRAFHDELLAEGALPLDLLQARMKAWLDRQKQKS